jgi:hypothetical protein
MMRNQLVSLTTIDAWGSKARPFTAKTRVRVPLGAPTKSMA